MRPPRSTPPRSRAVLASIAALAIVSTTGTVHAAPRPGGPAAAAAPSAPHVLAQPSPDLPGLPAVSPALSSVAVDSPPFRRARAAYTEVAAGLAERQTTRAGIDHALTDLEARLSRAQAELAAASARAQGLRSRLDAIDGALADLAVGLYAAGGPGARVDAALATEQPSINDADRRDVLGAASLDVLLAERAAYLDRLDLSERRRRGALAELRAARLERDQRLGARPAAVEAEAAAAPGVAEHRVAYEQARTLATVKGADFPLVALDAYVRAAAAVLGETPRCDLQWWGVAGVARVEGQHGSYGGAALDERGDATKRIIGIPLDGTNATQVVTDSDHGALDGDPVYDRAVGPMQFIPQTWLRFASDGNGDGVQTPFNLYDATLATARYLCLSSGGLGTDPGLRAAYLAYNHSDAYAAAVLSFARGYERAVAVPDTSD